MPDSLLSRLKKSARLPTPPGTAIQILRICQEDDISITELADVLAADPALSLRLLKYANSAMFGVRKEVTNVRDAVLLLGVRSVRLMALSFSLITTDDDRACPGFDFGRFWTHCLGAAVAARTLARQNHFLSPEEAFAAGMLSQLGKLVLAVGMPEEYAPILQASGGTLGRADEAEQAAFGTTACALGADLIEDWGIPQRLALTIRHQRSPEQIEEADLRDFARLIGHAVDIADLLCEAGTPETRVERWTGLCRDGVFSENVSQDEALAGIRSEFLELAGMLNLSAGIASNAREIQAQAGEVLGELSLAAQLKSEHVEKVARGLEQKAFTDALTGIANRAAFDKQLAHLWDEAARTQRPLGLILLDVDHFKRFNDGYGHRTGDAVLKAVAACLPRAVRQVDFVARYGGEEFAVIMPRVDRLIAAQICVKIRKAVEMCPVEFEGRVHRVTVSVGAALMARVSSHLSSNVLLEAADRQLYVSKQKGRNCCSMKQLILPTTHQPAVA